MANGITIFICLSLEEIFISYHQNYGLRFGFVIVSSPVFASNAGSLLATLSVVLLLFF